MQIALLNRFTSFHTAACILATFSASTFADTPAAEDITNAIAILGLTPEALAVIDVTPGEVSTLLDQMSESYDNYQSLLTLHETVSKSISDQRAYRAKLRFDPENTETQSLLSQAVTAESNARANVASATDALLAEVLDGLANTTLAEQVLANELHMTRLAPAYRLAVSTESDARELSWALKLEEILDRLQEGEMPTAASNAISLAHSQIDVNLGLARITQHEAGIRAAIDAWENSNQ